MTKTLICTTIIFAGCTLLAFAQAAAPAVTPAPATTSAPSAPDPATLRKDWIDPDTGHHVYRLSTLNQSNSLYFHYNSYSKDGKKVVFNHFIQKGAQDTPDGIWVADLLTKKSELVVPGVRALETSRTSNEVYYLANNTVMAADLDTKKTRVVVAIPDGLQISCVNCDGTLFAGTITDAPDPDGNDKAAKPDAIPSTDQVTRMFPGKKREELTPENILSATKENGLAQRLKDAVTATNPRCLFTLNAKTGEVKKFGYAYAWLNHLQFSPIDPNMLMYCHEGTWHEVTRVWTIRVDDPKAVGVSMHRRSMDMEIWGHEWWAPDGKSVGFDLQTPRSGEFWIANVPLVKDAAGNPGPGKEVRYHLERNWWGIHFGLSHDGKMYASDGGDPGQVSFAPDGEWINLLRIKPDGTLDREKLVNMKNHDYVTNASVPGHNGVEPNVTFTPDDKYIVFTGTFDGARQVYAVEIAK